MGGKEEGEPSQPKAQPLQPSAQSADCLRSKYLPSLSDSLSCPTGLQGPIVPHAAGAKPRAAASPAICSQLYINSEVLPPANPTVAPLQASRGHS